MRPEENRPEEPFEALKDYFGAYNDHKWNSIDELREQITNLKTQNEYLSKEAQNLTDEIEEAKAEAERKRKEQEELEQAEQDKKPKRRGRK